MKYRLTSIGFKISGFLTLLGCMTLAVLATIYRERVPLYGMIFIWTLVAILLFVFCCLLRHTIVLNYKKKKLIVGGGARLIIKKAINIDDILTIIVEIKSTSLQVFPMINVKLKNGKCYRTGGYTSVFKNMDVHKTETIVAQLNEGIANLQSK